MDIIELRIKRFEKKIKGIEKDIDMCIKKKLFNKKEWYQGYLEGLKEGLKILEDKQK